jgi:nicotinamide-nucleotide amidase
VPADGCGGIVAYARKVKQTLLQVDVSKIVSERAALAMAAGARRVLEADVTVA